MPRVSEYAPSTDYASVRFIPETEENMPYSRFIASCLAIVASATLLSLSARSAYAQNGGNGQFLSTYAGPQTAHDLLVDALSFSYDGTNFILRAVLDAPI